VLKGGTFNLKR